jgi:hypothetical protein
LDEKDMHEYKLNFTIALGGFLIFVGIIMMGVFAMMLFGFVDFAPLESQEYHMLSFGVLLVVGFLDLLAGVLLWRG